MAKQTVAIDAIAHIRSLPLIECGEEASKHFVFGDGYKNLNHGSFGTYPTEIRSVLRHYQDLAEARPDGFIRYDYPVLLDVSRDAVAKIVNANVEECVFLPNATTGINTVLRNLIYHPGDVIIYFSTIYGACEMTVKYLEETTPVEGKRITCTYPSSDDSVCKALENAIKEVKAEGKTPKLAIFDTISSLPGVRMPFEKLTKLCRSQDVLSCIDAAHCVGQIELDLKALDPDFFVSNCHKWLHVPRGCALFYVPTRNQHLLPSTLPTSHGFVPKPKFPGEVVFNPLPVSVKSAFVRNFEFVGTIDNSPYLCIPAAIEWRKKLTWKDLKGEAAVYAYTQDLASKAADLVAARLGTEVMENEEGTLTKCSLSNVRLPISFKEIAGSEMGTAIKIAQWIAKIILLKHNTFIAIFIHADAWWVRLSGQVYLTLKDFEFGADVLLAVSDAVKKGEWKES